MPMPIQFAASRVDAATIPQMGASSSTKGSFASLLQQARQQTPTESETASSCEKKEPAESKIVNQDKSTNERKSVNEGTVVTESKSTAVTSEDEGKSIQKKPSPKPDPKRPKSQSSERETGNHALIDSPPVVIVTTEPVPTPASVHLATLLPDQAAIPEDTASQTGIVVAAPAQPMTEGGPIAHIVPETSTQPVANLTTNDATRISAEVASNREPQVERATTEVEKPTASTSGETELLSVFNSGVPHEAEACPNSPLPDNSSGTLTPSSRSLECSQHASSAMLKPSPPESTPSASKTIVVANDPPTLHAQTVFGALSAEVPASVPKNAKGANPTAEDIGNNVGSNARQEAVSVPSTHRPPVSPAGEFPRTISVPMASPQKDSVETKPKETLPDASASVSALASTSPVSSSSSVISSALIPGTSISHESPDNAKASSGGSSAPDASHTPAPPAEVPPHALPDSAVHDVRLLDRNGQTEMHIGLRTTVFGNVEVHAVVRDSQVGLAIGSERGDLRHYLANEVPSIVGRLEQHDVRLDTVRFFDQGMSFNAGVASGSNPHQRTSTRVPLPLVQVSRGREQETVALESGLSSGATNSLNVRA